MDDAELKLFVKASKMLLPARSHSFVPVSFKKDAFTFIIVKCGVSADSIKYGPRQAFCIKGCWLSITSKGTVLA